MIYYGTELGMWGADDPHDRMPTNWSNPDRDIFDSYQSALQLRKHYAALRRGGFRVIQTDDTQQLFVFERRFNNETMIIAINRGDEDIRIESAYLKSVKLIYNTAGKELIRQVPRLSASIYIQK